MLHNDILNSRVFQVCGVLSFLIFVIGTSISYGLNPGYGFRNISDVWTIVGIAPLFVGIFWAILTSIRNNKVGLND